MIELEYAGLNGCDSICGVEFKVVDETLLVIFTELDDNEGTSVTNFIEQLATIVYKSTTYADMFKSREFDSIRWVEHYPATNYRKASYDDVQLVWDGTQFELSTEHPKWIHIGEELPF